MKTILILTAFFASITSFAQTKPRAKSDQPKSHLSTLLTEAELKKPLNEMSAKEYLRQALLVKIGTDADNDAFTTKIITDMGRSIKHSALDLYKDLVGSDETPKKSASDKSGQKPGSTPNRSTAGTKSGSL